MADKSLIAHLLKSPLEVRKEEEEALRQKGLERAALVRGGGGSSKSLFGGGFRDFAAQQAAEVDKRTQQVVKGLGQAAGMDMRSNEEKVAGAQQRILSEVNFRNLTSMKRARDRLIQTGAPASAIVPLNKAIAVKEQAVLDTQKQTLQNKAVADKLRNTSPELATAVENGSIPATEAMKIMYQNKYKNFKEVDGTLINMDTLKPVYTAEEEPEDSFVILSQDQIKNKGLDPSLTYQQNTKTGKLSVLGTEEIVPKAGAGYTVTRTRNENGTISYTQTPTPGGEVDQAIKKAQQAQQAGNLSTVRRVSRVDRQLTRARSYLQDPEARVAGKSGAAVRLGGQLTGGLLMAGTDQQDLVETYTTLRAGLAFDEIKRLTAQNPNGTTGLGPISNREFESIEKAIESLNPEASREAQLRNLDIIQENYDFLMQDLANKYTDEDLIANDLADAIPYRTKIVTVDPVTNEKKITYLTPEEVDDTPAGLRNLDADQISRIKGLIKNGGNLSNIAQTLNVTVQELTEYVQ